MSYWHRGYRIHASVRYVLPAIDSGVFGTRRNTIVTQESRGDQQVGMSALLQRSQQLSGALFASVVDFNACSSTDQDLPNLRETGFLHNAGKDMRSGDR